MRGQPSLVYRRDDERLVEFSATTVDTADDASLGDVAPFTVHVGRGDRLAFDSVRYAFTTSSPDMHPNLYVRKPGTTEFPPFTFVEDGHSNAAVLRIDEFGEAEFSQFPLHFLLPDDELPTELTVGARIVVAERDGGRRYVAEPTVTLELTEQ
ncbi:hypothetical protein GJR96_03045 [Haloferax sp. MBLA0076]|uniref:DUF8121 domain-containing protein n=1 Tax=Haloferax litoreum TaxID=2666140 RepID=A0A6A8GCX7_9EURY|nr:MULTISPECIES: hypothetical protein [Haloferax]KAB1192466.1 hypothetical protein Hfx1148_03040 [Haloferax sp. CBA1148]MRX20935.1 hypothetical protein [Haloferax litoreum]